MLNQGLKSYFTLPLLNKDRVQFKLNAIDFLGFPASESKDVIVERTAAVSADIEGLAVFSNLFHYLFRTRAAISSETVDNKLVLFKPFKEPLQRVLLVETKIFVKPNEQSQACLNSAMARKRATKWNICVAVAVLNADNQVANNRHARAITKELLVCRLRIILLSLYELVVEVNVIPLALFQLPCGQ